MKPIEVVPKPKRAVISAMLAKAVDSVTPPLMSFASLKLIAPVDKYLNYPA